jgi:hypothetical protein
MVILKSIMIPVVAVLAARVAFFPSRKQHMKRIARRIEELKQRERESDEQFIARCGFHLNAGEGRIVSISRAIIADWEHLPPSCLHSSDRFSHELSMLSISDDFDAVRFAQALNERLGVSVGRRQIERLLYPGLPRSNETIGDFACRVVQAIRETAVVGT